MDTLVDTTIVDKLKKLLTLSKGASGAEAETALAMAMRLATKHEIDISSIQLANPEQKKEEMVKSDVHCGARMSVAQKWISWILQDHFKVSLVYSGSRWSGRKLYFLGRKSDVEFAKYVQDFLNEHMLRSWQYYMKSHKVETRYRATYFSGFHRGLSQKLTEAKKAQETQSFAEISEPVRAAAQNNYSLIVVSEKQARKQFMTEVFGKLGNVRRASCITYNNGANSAGFAAGQSTNIARPLN